MNLVAYLYRQSWSWLLLAALAGIVSGLSGAALVAVIGQGINAGGEALGKLAIIFFSLALLHLVSKSGSEIILLRLTQAAICELRIRLSRKLLAAPQARLQATGKSGLLVILTKDVDTFTHSFVTLPVAFGNLIIVVTCFAYMAWLSLSLFLMLVTCLVLGVLLFYIVERRPLKLMSKVRDQMDTLYEHFRDLIEGSRELQLNRRRSEIFLDRVLASEAMTFRKTVIGSMMGYTFAVNLGTILFFVVIGIMLFVAPHWTNTTRELLATVTLTLLYLMRPISELVISMPIVRNAGIAFGRIRQLDQDLGEEKSRSSASSPVQTPFSLASDRWTLELRGIRHHYPSSSDDSQFVLGPLDLSIGQGEILYIVGGNGSGKTTLAMLLLGLYRPDEGRIFLNGVEITEANIDAYRQNFSAVFADFHLFEHLPDPDASDIGSRARHYLDVLGMSHKVKVEAGKFTTLNLSTGQRKRLALVSAYLEDRPIYLFDEWAADQDPAFKRVFYTELLPELKSRGKTVIVITHDDAYFSCADRILKLQDGHRAG